MENNKKFELGDGDMDRVTGGTDGDADLSQRVRYADCLSDHPCEGGGQFTGQTRQLAACSDVVIQVIKSPTARTVF